MEKGKNKERGKGREGKREKMEGRESIWTIDWRCTLFYSINPNGSC